MRPYFTPRSFIDQVALPELESRSSAEFDPAAGTGHFLVPHEGAPLTEAPGAGSAASPQSAARADKIDRERPAPAAGFVAAAVVGFIIAGCLAVAAAG